MTDPRPVPPGPPDTPPCPYCGGHISHLRHGAQYACPGKPKAAPVEENELHDYHTKSGPPPVLDATVGFDTRRAVGCILAYIDEERRAQTRFNDLNARAVEALLRDWCQQRNLLGGRGAPNE